MFTRITTVFVDPTRAKEAMQQWKVNVTEIWKQQKGYIRGYLLMNSRTGKGKVVSLWETQADAEAYESTGAFSRAIDPFRHFFIAPPMVDGFDLYDEG